MRKIKLTNGSYTLVDNEDYDWLSKMNWYANGEGYPMTSIRRNSVYRRLFMHRLIMNPPRDKSIDHINHNKLDNRRKNLRICTHTENVRNRKVRANKSSKYKGVYPQISRSKKNPWMATIKFNFKTYYIGMFPTEIAAAKAYNKKAKELHGEFAFLNKIHVNK